MNYRKAQLERGHMAAVKADDGWRFFKTVEFEDTHIEYNGVDVMAAAAGTHSIRNGSVAAAAWQAWTTGAVTTLGPDIFYEDSKDKMLQCFIGIDTPEVRMFRQIPDGAARGKLSLMNIAVINLDAIGFINGVQSPFIEPDEISEMILPWETHVTFGLYNPTPQPVQPMFNIFIRRIVPEFLDPRKAVDQQTIKDIFRGTAKCRRWSPGIGASGLDFIYLDVPGIARWGSLEVNKGA